MTNVLTGIWPNQTSATVSAGTVIIRIETHAPATERDLDLMRKLTEIVEAHNAEAHNAEAIFND
jgi:hypothetical protein